MARIVVLLLIIASAAMFVFVLKAPVGFFFNKGSVEAETAGPTPAKTIAPKAAADRKAAGSRKRFSGSPEQTSSDFQAAAASAVTNPTLTTGSRPGAERPREIVWTISGESVPIYSTNSTRGTVLQTLKKGDVVGNNLEVLAAGERWILVNVQNQNISGFMRQDNAVRKPQESARQ